MPDEFQHVLRYIRTIEGMLNKLEAECESLQDNLAGAEEHAASLEQIMYACEAANYKHLARIDQLEQLCKCMYANFGNYAMSHDERGLLSLMDVFTPRMGELGLLKGEQE